MRFSAHWVVHERCFMTAMGTLSGRLRVLQLAEFDFLSHGIEVVNDLQHVRFVCVNIQSDALLMINLQASHAISRLQVRTSPDGHRRSWQP